MFVSDDLLLIRNFYLDDRILIKDDRLTTKAAFNPWINGPVNEVFFFIADFLQRIFSLVHINVAGAAGANFTTVVIQVNFILFGYFENANVRRDVLHRLGGDAFVFEGELDCCHVLGKN